MPGRDMNTIVRDMKKCIDYTAQWFRENDIPIDPAHVGTVALAMFNDYRNNSPRDVERQRIEGEKELLMLRKQLKLKR